MLTRAVAIKILLVALVLTLLSPMAFSAQVIKPGTSCKVFKQTIVYANKTYTCIKSGKKLVLNKCVTFKKPTPTPTPTPTTQNGSCTKIGERIILGNTYRECRWVKGKQLIWFDLNKIPKSFSNPISPQDVSQCKIKGDDLGYAVLGFGSSLVRDTQDRPRVVPPIGTNRSLIVPIDFSDYPGDSNLKEIIESERKQYLEWIQYYSAGKLTVQLDYLDRWIRAPLPSSEYNLDNVKVTLDKRTAEGDELTRIYAQKYIDFVTKEIDLTKYETIYILYPSQQKVLRDFVPRVKFYNVKEGKTVLSVFAPGVFSLNRGMPYWAFWIHETSHDWGLKGHAPGDGWPLGLMATQDGLSLNPSGWDQFLLTWLPDDQVYCETKQTLKTAEVKLSPLQREDKQTKIIAIALDDSRLLVIESHGIDKWSSRRLDSTAQNYGFGEYGFYGVFVYIVTTKEQGLLVRDQQGANLAVDDGNNDTVPRQARAFPIVGAASNNYNLNNFGNGITNDNYIAVQGDYFVIEGIKITFIEANDYNTVRIEKG